jgi:hypothetical protein
VAGCGGVWAFGCVVATKVATVSKLPKHAWQPREWVCRMKLTPEQSQKLLQERGIWITEACDRCGQLLGSVRWTRKGEPGEWCSAACRDGVKAERPTFASIEVAAAVNRRRQKRIGSRPSGRPRTHATNAEKQRFYRNRLKNGLALRNTPPNTLKTRN